MSGNAFEGKRLLLLAAACHGILKMYARRKMRIYVAWHYGNTVMGERMLTSFSSYPSSFSRDNLIHGYLNASLTDWLIKARLRISLRLYNTLHFT